MITHTHKHAHTPEEEEEEEEGEEKQLINAIIIHRYSMIYALISSA